MRVWISDEQQERDTDLRGGEGPCERPRSHVLSNWLSNHLIGEPERCEADGVVESISNERWKIVELLRYQKEENGEEIEEGRRF